jgi:hypothetical protein
MKKRFQAAARVTLLHLGHQALLQLLRNGLKAEMGSSVEAGGRKTKERFLRARIVRLARGSAAAAASILHGI